MLHRIVTATVLGLVAITLIYVSISSSSSTTLPTHITDSPAAVSTNASETVDGEDHGAADPTSSASPISSLPDDDIIPVSRMDKIRAAAVWGVLPKSINVSVPTHFEDAKIVINPTSIDGLLATLRTHRKVLAVKRLRWLEKVAPELVAFHLERKGKDRPIDHDSLHRSTARRLHHEFYGASAGDDVACVKQQGFHICNRTEPFIPPTWSPHTAEGTCTSKIPSVFSAFSEQELRVLLQLDKLDADESESTPKRTRVKVHPTLDWMRRSRWFLNEFIPFANESTCVPQQKSARFAFVQSKFTKGSRSIARNKNELKLRSAKRPFYHLSNVCINAEGGGMSAYFGPTQGKELIFMMNDIADEKRQAIRDILFVRNRMAPPRCLVDTPVLLHPVIFQSDNLGHVMYRILAAQNLVTNFRKKGLNFNNTITGFYVTPSAKLTFGDANMYKVFYQFLGSRWFSVTSPGDIFEAKARKGSMNALDTKHDLCFSNVYVGWDAIPLYPGKRPADLRRQIKYTSVLWSLRFRILDCFMERFGSVKALAASGLGTAEDAVLGEDASKKEEKAMTLMQDEGESWISKDQSEDERTVLQKQQETAPWVISELPFFSRKTTVWQRRAGGVPSSPIAITFISRRKRRLLNEQALASRVVSFLGSNVFLRVVDFDGMSVKQQVAIASSTDVLIGIHGTAMQWALVMPVNGVLVEFQYPQYACTPPGVNSLLRRHCEFGQTTKLIMISHVAFMVSREDVVGCQGITQCNLNLSIARFDIAMNAALCSLAKGSVFARRHCDWGFVEQAKKQSEND